MGRFLNPDTTPIPRKSFEASVTDLLSVLIQIFCRWMHVHFCTVSSYLEKGSRLLGAISGNQSWFPSCRRVTSSWSDSRYGNGGQCGKSHLISYSACSPCVALKSVLVIHSLIRCDSKAHFFSTILQAEPISTYFTLLNWLPSRICACSNPKWWRHSLQARSQWAGGVTNHQDAFQHVFRILLGLYSLAVSPGTAGMGEGVQAQLKTALTVLTQFPLNPLVRKLSHLLNQHMLSWAVWRRLW